MYVCNTITSEYLFIFLQVLVTVMGGIAPMFAYATDIIATQRVTYNQNPPVICKPRLVPQRLLQLRWPFQTNGYSSCPRS